MSTDLKKHTSIAAGEKPVRAALAAALQSVNDIVPVANATEANQIAAALTATGVNLASTPLTVRRADAPGLHTLEISKDGAAWAPASGILHFSTTGARNTWTAANSALLAAGDACWVGFTQYLWSGTAWVGGSSAITFTGIYGSSGSLPVLITTEGHRAYLEGVVTSGSATFNAGTSYTLAAAGGVPAAFHPGVTRTFACTANATAVGAVSVLANGSMSMVLNTSFTGALNLTLDGVTWRIA